MTNIKGIIANHRAKLEAAGLLREVRFAKLSPKVAAMRPSLYKVRMALQEQPDRFAVKSSPMATLFDYALPTIEHILIELGEARAEQIIGRLCEHGKAMIEEHGIDGSRGHLQGLFEDLVHHETMLKIEGGVNEIISAYRKLDFEANEKKYLGLYLGNKIKEMQTDKHGMISLIMYPSINDPDLAFLQRVRNLHGLSLATTNISNAGLKYLKGLRNLLKLNLAGTQVSDVTPLSGLSSLQVLNLTATRVSNVAPLGGLSSLRELSLVESRVSDIAPLGSLTSLRELRLAGDHISDAQVKELKRKIPGLEIYK